MKREIVRYEYANLVFLSEYKQANTDGDCQICESEIGKTRVHTYTYE